MKKEDIFLNTLVFLEDLKAGKRQHELLQSIYDFGIRKVEIRREFIIDIAEELVNIYKKVKELNMELFYAIPDWLFKKGKLQLESLKQYLVEAELMGAKALKFNVGEFGEISDEEIEEVNNLIEKYDVLITVENDQTELNGRINTIKEFLTLSRARNLNIHATFDIGNWYWVEESPVENAEELKEFVRFIHLKDAIIENGMPRAAYLDEGTIDWRSILEKLPKGLSIAIEYPCGNKPFDILNEGLNKLLA